MRLTVSILGTAGVMLVVLGLNAPWLVFEAEGVNDYEWSYDLCDFSWGVNDITDGEHNAYAVALYLVIVGAAISVSSLLGGFATLAGMCTFIIGALMDDRAISRGGGGTSIEASMSLGIGFYIALIGTALTIIAIWYPLDVSSDGRQHPKPGHRTWHLGRSAGR